MPEMRALILALAVTLGTLAGCSSSTGTTTDVPAQSTFLPVPASEVRPAKVSIPALHVESDVIDLGLQPDGTMQVPPDAKDAGWYTSSPTPGQPGPAVIAAHISWAGVDGPFKHLGNLKQGDEVIVESTDGAEVTFVIDRVETHSKQSFPADEVYSDTKGAEIRLISCGGEYDAAAKSYLSNVIAFGHLKG